MELGMPVLILRRVANSNEENRGGQATHGCAHTHKAGGNAIHSFRDSEQKGSVKDEEQREHWDPCLGSSRRFNPDVHADFAGKTHMASLVLAAALEPIAIGIKLPMPITGMLATRESHHPLGRIRWCFSCDR